MVSVLQKRGQSVMRLRRVARAFWVVAAVVVLAGCAEQRPGVEPVVRQRPQPYVMAVRYEVEPALRRVGFDWAEEAGKDLAHIRKLGFDTVEAAWLTDEQMALMLPAAAEQKLAVAASSQTLHDFITEGVGTESATGGSATPVIPWAGNACVRAVVLMDQPTARLLPALEGVIAAVQPVLGLDAGFWVGVDAETLSTAVQLPPPAVALVWRGVIDRETLAEAASIVAGHRRLVQLELPWEGDPAEESRRVIAARASAWVGLAGGWTDGVVMSRYRSWAGRNNGLVETEQSMNRRDTAGIRKWLKQLELFGDRVKGAHSVADAEVLGEGDDALEVAVLIRGSFRWVLTYSRDTERVVTGTLRVPETWLGRSVSRVVNVQSLKRFESSEGEVTIPVRIAPGEAMLFEAF